MLAPPPRRGLSARGTGASTAGARAARHRRAFTLVELMAVIMILGLIGGVAYVSWVKVLPSQRLNTAVRNLSEVLHETRAQAIAHSKEYEIHYDLDNESYSVRTPFRELGGGYALIEEDRLFIHETYLRDYGVEIVRLVGGGGESESGRHPVYFSPLGAAASHSIVLHQLNTERWFTLEVMPLTGEIRFHDGIYEREPVEEGDFR